MGEIWDVEKAREYFKKQREENGIIPKSKRPGNSIGKKRKGFSNLFPDLKIKDFQNKIIVGIDPDIDLNGIGIYNVDKDKVEYRGGLYYDNLIDPNNGIIKIMNEISREKKDFVIRLERATNKTIYGRSQGRENEIVANYQRSGLPIDVAKKKASSKVFSIIKNSGEGVLMSKMIEYFFSKNGYKVFIIESDKRVNLESNKYLGGKDLQYLERHWKFRAKSDLFYEFPTKMSKSMIRSFFKDLGRGKLSSEEIDGLLLCFPEKKWNMYKRVANEKIKN